MEIMEIAINRKKHICKVCDYITCNKNDFAKHITTAKHKNNANGNILEIQEIAEIATNETYTCNCSKVFITNSGLWKHKKKCNDVPDTTNINNLTNLVIEVVKSNNAIQVQNLELQKQNQEMQKQILDVCKNGIVTNNTINSHNKTFNLQVFLNEDCKDAMNITDFVDSIKFQLADLEHMGKVGYVEGISNIIIRNLKALDVTKRPVHCTDQKRETIYIKDAGVWTKEDEDNKNVRKLIKKVAFRNSKTLSLFKAKYPDCITSESKYSDTYSKIVIEAMGGGSKCNDYDSENKIIRKIAKEKKKKKIHL
jgi:hypothetical protein